MQCQLYVPCLHCMQHRLRQHERISQSTLGGAPLELAEDPWSVKDSRKLPAGPASRKRTEPLPVAQRPPRSLQGSGFRRPQPALSRRRPRFAPPPARFIYRIPCPAVCITRLRGHLQVTAPHATGRRSGARPSPIRTIRPWTAQEKAGFPLLLPRLADS